MRKQILLIAFFLSTTVAYTQSGGTCFDDQMKEGRRLFAIDSFMVAKDRFESAKFCPRPNIDTISYWVDHCYAANNLKMEKLLEDVLREEDKAKKNARLNLSNYLSLLSNKIREEGNDSAALFFAFQAYQIQGDTASPEIQFSFGQAAFEYYSREMELPSDILKVIDLPQQPGMIIVLCNDQNAYRVDLSNHRFEAYLQFDHFVHPHAIKANQTHIVAGDRSGQLYIKNFKTGKEKKLAGHPDAITSVALSPDGKTILSCSRDSSVMGRDFSGNPVYRLKGHQGKVYEAFFSDQGDRILSRSSDCSVGLWDSAGRKIKFLKEENSYVHFASFMNDKIVTGNADGNLSSWNDRGIFVSTTKAANQPIRQLSLLDQNQRYLSFAEQNDPLIWTSDMNTSISLKHPEEELCTAIALSDPFIYSGTNKGAICKWNTGGALIERFAKHLGRRVVNIHYSDQHQLFLSAGEDNFARLWNEKGQALMTLKSAGTGRHSRIFDDNGTILSLSESNRLLYCYIPAYYYQSLQNKLPFSKEQIEQFYNTYQVKRLD